MSDLSTNFKDDVLNTSVNQKRRYQMIYNSDGTVSFEDVTNYSQVGSDYGANEVNEERGAINGKQDKITGAASTITASNLTANRALISNGSGKVAASAVTSTELGCLDGAKSNIQDQIDELNSNLDQKIIRRSISFPNQTVSAGQYAILQSNCEYSGYTALGVIGFDVNTANQLNVHGTSVSGNTVYLTIRNDGGSNHNLSGAFAHVIYVKD